jgi:predicted nucleic acid-binding Zn ribbon protein
MRRVKRIEKIDAVLSRVLKNVGIESEVLEKRVLFLWNTIVDKRISSQTKPLYVKDNILFIKIESPVWAKELSFFKKDLVKRINSELKRRFLRDISFVT